MPRPSLPGLAGRGPTASRPELSRGRSVDGGWTVVVVHESKEKWEQFRDSILLPKMQQGIAGGFATPPQETAAIDVYKLLP